MDTEGSSDDISEALERIIERAAQSAFDDLLWKLEELVGTFHDAADRLVEEQRRIDMMRSEMARTANGQDALRRL